MIRTVTQEVANAPTPSAAVSWPVRGG